MFQKVGAWLLLSVWFGLLFGFVFCTGFGLPLVCFTAALLRCVTDGALWTVCVTDGALWAVCATDGALWTVCVTDGAFWTVCVTDGALWTVCVTDGALWTVCATDGALWTVCVTDGALWTVCVTDGALWTVCVTDGALWTVCVTDGALWTVCVTDGALYTVCVCCCRYAIVSCRYLFLFDASLVLRDYGLSSFLASFIYILDTTLIVLELHQKHNVVYLSDNCILLRENAYRTKKGLLANRNSHLLALLRNLIFIKLIQFQSLARQCTRRHP